MLENRSRNYAGTFNSEVIKWRQIAAKIWSIVFIFFFILCHSVTANLDLLNNFSGILTGFFGNLFYLYFWSYSSIILIIFWIMFMFNDNLFRVSHKVYANNFEKLLQIVYSMNMVCIIANLISSLFISSMLLQFYESKEHLSLWYITSFCAFSNLVYKLKFTFNGKYLLNWPIIEQPKYCRFKSRVYKTALNTVKSVFYNLILWNIFYFGSGLVGTFFGLTEESQSLFSTWIVCLKLSFLINFSHAFSWDLYEIYMTEIYHFNVQPVDASDLSLATAMSLNSHPYIQTLSLIDFADLSIYSKARRNQIFSLNFNNQPVNWNKISNEALNVIKDFMEVFNFDDMLHGSDKQNKQMDEVVYKRAGVLSPMRDLASPLKSPIRKAHLNETYVIPAKSPIKLTKSLDQHVNSFGFKFTQSLIEKLKKQKHFAMIYKENVNYKTQQLFVDSFLVINALKGLSNMTMASLTEDEYGIVQQNLSDIINTFVNLQKVVEKFNQTSPSGSVSFRILQKSHPDQIDLYIQKLTFVLNESIYKITHTFGSSLRSLSLDEDVMRRLQKYQLKQ